MPRKLTDRQQTDFAPRLKSLRESRGWSQSALAGRAGVSQVLISALESGIKQPGWDTAIRLARALGIPVCEFGDGCTKRRKRPA